MRNTRLKLTKNISLIFSYLKIIRIFNPLYHPKIKADIPKIVQKASKSI